MDGVEGKNQARVREREMVQYESGDDTMHEATQTSPRRTGGCMYVATKQPITA